jgi:DNA-binding protein WhiA
MAGMALTALVKQEIARVPVTRLCCRTAAVCTLVRFAGGLQVVRGRVVVQARVDTQEAAGRLCRDIAEVFGMGTDLIVLPPGGPRRQEQYLVRVVRGGAVLGRRAGLLDGAGRPVRGLPPRVVAGPVCDAGAIWRAAFLAAGTLTRPGRSCAVTVTCPGPETSLALAGAARRLRIPARTRQEQGTDQVVVATDDTIEALLTRLGAPGAVTLWQEQRTRYQARLTGYRLSNFQDANGHRAARAAAAACARVERALVILGDDIPDHLRAAGRLRLEHPDASLEDLARLTDPPLTKDAVAGRIRRLLRLAGTRAARPGLPDTGTTLTPDLAAAGETGHPTGPPQQVACPAAR